MALTWSSCVLDAHGDVLGETDADTAQSTASIGKVFLLCEAAERIVDGRLDPRTVLSRDSELAVSDSGLWQHLMQDSLPLVDACLLIGAVSDNWATNIVLDVVGIPAVRERAVALGCVHSGLHDRVRDARSEADPPNLSTATARELAEVARRIHVASSGDVVPGISTAGAELVQSWLLAGVDLSMVAAPFHLDPLAHTDGAPRLWSKTGTDAGVRADMGVIWSYRDAVAYAAIANWDPREDRVAEAMQRMHEVGENIAARTS
ncbi:MAG: hypothetical protein RL347_2154 [Actinomycetota bacterium]